MITFAETRPDAAAVDDSDAMGPISPLIDDLMAYADGRPVDRRTRSTLDEMIFDYIDGDLDGELAGDLETSMGLFPNVASLVAEKAEEVHLRNRLSMFFDGELDPKDAACIQAMIDGDPEVAKLARQIRQGGDCLRMVLQPIPGQHAKRYDVEAIKAEFFGASDAAASIACFSVLIDYALGLTIDEERQDLLEDMISRYIDGTLDRASTLGLEASMRLVPSVARLIADEIERRCQRSRLTPDLRHRALERRVVRPARDRSRSFDSV